MVRSRRLAYRTKPSRSGYLSRVSSPGRIVNMKVTALRTAIVAALPLFCLSAVAAEGPLAMKKGQGGSEIQGSAGPGGSQGDNGLEHCDKPMGAMAVVEPQDYVAQSLSRYRSEEHTSELQSLAY